MKETRQVYTLWAHSPTTSLLLIQVKSHLKIFFWQPGGEKLFPMCCEVHCTSNTDGPPLCLADSCTYPLHTWEPRCVDTLLGILICPNSFTHQIFKEHEFCNWDNSNPERTVDKADLTPTLRIYCIGAGSDKYICNYAIKLHCDKNCEGRNSGAVSNNRTDIQLNCDLKNKQLLARVERRCKESQGERSVWKQKKPYMSEELKGI